MIIKQSEEVFFPSSLGTQDAHDGTLLNCLQAKETFINAMTNCLWVLKKDHGLHDVRPHYSAFYWGNFWKRSVFLPLRRISEVKNRFIPLFYVCVWFCFFTTDFSVTSLKMAVILTLSVMAAWTVQTTLLSAPPLTLTSPKWTPVMTGLAQVRRPHCFLWGSVEYSERVSKYATIFFSGGQSDQGYDSLSKEEERFCSRETDGTALAEEKMLRRAGES